MSEREPNGTAPNALRQPFLIALNSTHTQRVDPQTMVELAAQLEADPEVEVQSIASPQGYPERLLVTMTAERADALRNAHRGALLVESDKPLSLLEADPEAPKRETMNAKASDSEDKRTSQEGTGQPTPVRVESTPKRQYLVASRIGPNASGFTPQATLQLLENVLNEDPDIDVVRTLTPRGALGALSEGITGPSRVFVARMADAKAELLRTTGEPRGVVVEIDHPLRLAVPFDGPDATLSLLDVAALGHVGGALHINVSVVDDNGRPIPNAQVMLYGNGFPAQSTTDANGQTELLLPGNTLDTIRAIYVKPAADFWDFYLEVPRLLENTLNEVRLQPLGEPAIGWGQRALNLDKLPPTITGKGVTVAVIDSGVASSHPALKRVNSGSDLTTTPANPNGWATDVVMHGTHCAGVIGGALSDTVHGVASEANVVAVKIFPGGHNSNLIDALDFCIGQQVDVVNLSLGSDAFSEIVEQKLAQAKALGIACIVAAGNSGGAVLYPGRSRQVLAVSAIGKLGEFPPGTYHAQTVAGDPRSIGPDGYFSAKFSCFGNEVAVCGPGVAIVSTVPPSNYAAWDGTSMAAPHIAGLAALLLADHADFKNAFKAKNANRVDRLFQIIRDSARPIPGIDRTRAGAGLPDAQRAFGLAATSGLSSSSHPETLIQDLQRMLAGLQASMGAAPGTQLRPMRQQLELLGVLPPNPARPFAAQDPLRPQAAGPQPPVPGGQSRADVHAGKGNGHAGERERIAKALADLRAQMQRVHLLPA